MVGPSTKMRIAGDATTMAIINNTNLTMKRAIFFITFTGTYNSYETLNLTGFYWYPTRTLKPCKAMIMHS